MGKCLVFTSDIITKFNKNVAACNSAKAPQMIENILQCNNLKGALHFMYPAPGLLQWKAFTLFQLLTSDLQLAFVAW